MILAGIDEAGYGPLLGPLVVGCCALELPDRAGEVLPCLWKRLRRVVSKNRTKTGRKLHINDSKQVYSPNIGLKELERSMLALAACSGIWAERLEELLAHVAGDLPAQLGGYAWYAPFDGERFPLEQEPVSVRVMANALRTEMDKCDLRCVHLAARVVCEKRLNELMELTRNKSSVLFSTSAIHLDHLLRNFGDRGLVIFCDRQGGREHYGQLLRQMFEEWSLEVVDESDGNSEYRLARHGNSVRLLWREKAEAQCMPVAVASMLSKYLREALMNRFNAWWRKQLPTLEPTAGYYNDGLRFLRDIDVKRRELGIADAALVRSR